MQPLTYPKHFRVLWRRSALEPWQATECDTMLEAVKVKKEYRHKLWAAKIQYRDYHSGEWVG